MLNDKFEGSSRSISAREDLGVARVSVWAVGSSETTWVCVPISVVSCLTMSVVVSVMFSPYCAICMGASSTTAWPTMATATISSGTTSKTSINSDWTKHLKKIHVSFRNNYLDKSSGSAIGAIGCISSISSRSSWSSIRSTRMSSSVHSIHSTSSLGTVTAVTSATSIATSSVNNKLIDWTEIEQLIEWLIMYSSRDLYCAWLLRYSRYPQIGDTSITSFDGGTTVLSALSIMMTILAVSPVGSRITTDVNTSSYSSFFLHLI